MTDDDEVFTGQDHHRHVHTRVAADAGKLDQRAVGWLIALGVWAVLVGPFVVWVLDGVVGNVAAFGVYTAGVAAAAARSAYVFGQARGRADVVAMSRELLDRPTPPQ